MSNLSYITPELSDALCRLSTGGGFGVRTHYENAEETVFHSSRPIIINGIDASYAVVEGEWGLGKNEQVQPTIYGGRYIDPDPQVGHYYPSAGHMPALEKDALALGAVSCLAKPLELQHLVSAVEQQLERKVA